MDHNGIDWHRIENFIGFGRRGAPVVFIGMEEGLQAGTDLVADLRARSTYDQYMDLHRAQHALKGCEKYFGHAAVCQRTWRPMCHLMLRRFGITRPTKSERAEYQAMQLGRSDGDTLLTELLPYPSHDKGAWPYGDIGRFKTRAAYEREMLPRRIGLLRELIVRDDQTEIIVCYGKAHWLDFGRLFDDVTWTDSGVFRTALFGTTHVVLAPHLSGRAFNTEEQLNQFADVALAHRAGPTHTVSEDDLFPVLIADDFVHGKSYKVFARRSDDTEGEVTKKRVGQSDKGALDQA